MFSRILGFKMPGRRGASAKTGAAPAPSAPLKRPSPPALSPTVPKASNATSKPSTDADMALSPLLRKNAQTSKVAPSSPVLSPTVPQPRLDAGVEKRKPFYIPENVIGVTGFGKTATVYYRSPSGSFGRITATHELKNNVGRQPIKNVKGYKAENIKFDDGKWHYHETIPGEDPHTSRHPLRRLSEIKDPETLEQVRTAHVRFTKTKDIEAARAELAELEKEEKLKAAIAARANAKNAGEPKGPGESGP